MTIKPLIAPEAFVGLENLTHLCTGGEAPWLKSQDEVYAEFSRLKSGGYTGRQRVYALGEECRRKMGRLWDVPSERIAFMASAADGMNWLARGLDWRRGDNVVTDNLEFPSVAYAWRNLQQQGVEVRMVPHRDWTVDEADLLAAVDARTRVLAVSHASFYSGQCLDLQKLAAVRQRGVLLAVDATHSSGVVQVLAGLTDLCVSSSYKWMLATHGVAPCYLSAAAEAQTTESSFGWHNLAVWPPQGAERLAEVEVKPMPDKMEPGNPSMAIILFLNAALEILLEIGPAAIQEHARDLADELTHGLQAMGRTVISSKNRQARSGNTCFLDADAKGVQDRLEEQRVFVWGEYGRVRVSGHLYNSSEDVVRFLAALARVG
jgi:selenocysteine lyase/cysteine desulfurase